MRAEVGEQFDHGFSFSQDDVVAFANVTGDHNPVHLDAAYASQTPFKRPILHGFLSASVFTRVFGTIFPGPGSIYMSQELNFKRPMYPDQHYVATFLITETDSVKGTMTIACKITDSNGKVTLDGVARLLNKSLFNG